MADNKFMKVMPKQLANQLNLIKKDKESDLQRQQKIQSEEGTLQSDKIIQSQFKRKNSSPKSRYNNNSDSDDDKWKKIAPKQKQIKKISLSSVKDNQQKWQKNAEVVPVVVKPKKKITIQRDETGKAYFESEIIKPSGRESNHSRIINHLQNQDYQRMEQEERDSLDDSYDNQERYNDENIHKQTTSNQSVGRKLNIKKNTSKNGYIQVDYLPRQIDNQYLQDLLKKEKDNIIDSYRQDNFGRVQFNSKEAAERAVTILNKRTLYGQELSSYEINGDDYENKTYVQNNDDRNKGQSRFQTKNRK